MKKQTKRITGMLLSLIMLITWISVWPLSGFTAAAEEDYLKLTGNVSPAGAVSSAALGNGVYTMTVNGAGNYGYLYFNNYTTQIDYDYCYVDVISIDQPYLYWHVQGISGTPGQYLNEGINKIGAVNAFGSINAAGIYFGFAWDGGATNLTMTFSVYFSDDPDFTLPEPEEPEEYDVEKVTGMFQTTSAAGTEVTTGMIDEGVYRLYNTSSSATTPTVTVIQFDDYESIEGFDYIYIDFYKQGTATSNQWNGVRLYNRGGSYQYNNISSGCYQIGGKLPEEGIEDLRFEFSLLRPTGSATVDIVFSIYFTNDPNFKVKPLKITGNGQYDPGITPTDLSTVDSANGVYQAGGNGGYGFGSLYFNSFTSKLDYKYCYIDILSVSSSEWIWLSVEGVCHNVTMTAATGLIKLIDLTYTEDDGRIKNPITPQNATSGLMFTFQKLEPVNITFSIYFSNNSELTKADLIQPETKTVTFNLRNGTLANKPLTLTGTAGGSVQYPYAPVRTDFTFGGWYTDADCISIWNEELAATNITVYAKWTPTKDKKLKDIKDVLLKIKQLNQIDPDVLSSVLTGSEDQMDIITLLTVKAAN